MDVHLSQRCFHFVLLPAELFVLIRRHLMNYPETSMHSSRMRTVPNACCLYLPACTARGGRLLPGGVCLWSGGSGVCSQRGWVSSSGPGGVCSWSGGYLLGGSAPGGGCLLQEVCIPACNGTDTPLWIDRHLWKHCLRKLRLRAVTKITRITVFFDSEVFILSNIPINSNLFQWIVKSVV